MIKDKSYWRGYIDSQDGKTHYAMQEWEIVTAKRTKTLFPLAKLLDAEIEKYRSGFYITLPSNWTSVLPLVKDLNYIRGWFAARGRIYEDETGKVKLTISGINVDKFHTLVSKLCHIELPLPQLPSKSSKMRRIIVTGQLAKQLLNIIEGGEDEVHDV